MTRTLPKTAPLALALFPLFLRPAPPADGPADALIAEAREALAADDADEALAKLGLALEYRPDDVALLQLASEAAFAAEDDDRGLWYAGLALEGCGDDEAGLATAEGLRASMLEADPLDGKAAAIRDAFGEALFELGEVASRQKLYLNAVDLYGRCERTVAEGRAEKQLARLYENDKAVDAMLATGIVVPGKERRRKKSLEKILREDEQHATWENAWEFKSDNYRMQTNLGQELGQDLLRAMEQMNQFYRSVFKYKQRGGGTATCGISIYRSREEFDEFENGPDPNVSGFYQPGVNRVATYDPRTQGQPLSELFSTLFHEASHQFTHIISSSLVPGWLNEGTASYFEGARILPNGVVETNLVPEERLYWLLHYLEQGSPTLKDVVSYHQPGSYDGSYYPFGWGLVYFMRNYEDANSERVYVEPYEEFMASYKSGGKHDTFERFVEFFVEKPKQAGVTTFEDFEKRFTEWIVALGDVYFGPEERAALLIEKARRQLANKKVDAAIESYRFALRKRPDDAVASYELGVLMADEKQKDAAAYRLRQALAFARRDPAQAKALEEAHGDPLEVCMERLRKLNRTFAEKLAAAEQEFITASVAAAREYADVGLPRTGLRVLDTGLRMLGHDASIVAERAGIAAEHGVDTHRWRRLPLEELAWERSEEWEVDEQTLKVDAKRPQFAFWRDEPPESFRYEGAIEPAEPDGSLFVGLVVAANEEVGYHVLGLDSLGRIELALLKDEWKEVELWEDVFSRKQLAGFTFAVDVDGRKATFWLDGEKLGEHTFSASELEGRIGLYAQGGESAFRDLRVRY